MSKHELWELQQMQSLPLRAKVQMTITRIRAWVEEYGEDGVYIAFSGGLDSRVLLHIARSIYPDLVKYWTKKYQNFHNYEDIVSSGVIGMIDALDRTQSIDTVNYGYLRKYVAGHVAKYIGKLDANLYTIQSKKGMYERADCLSIDVPIDDDNLETLANTIPDDRDDYENVLLAHQFEEILDKSNVRHKDKIMLLLDGYEKAEIARMIGCSYEALRQQLKKLSISDIRG